MLERLPLALPVAEVPPQHPSGSLFVVIRTHPVSAKVVVIAPQHTLLSSHFLDVLLDPSKLCVVQIILLGDLRPGALGVLPQGILEDGLGDTLQVSAGGCRVALHHCILLSTSAASFSNSGMSSSRISFGISGVISGSVSTSSRISLAFLTFRVRRPVISASVSLSS